MFLGCLVGFERLTEAFRGPGVKTLTGKRLHLVAKDRITETPPPTHKSCAASRSNAGYVKLPCEHHVEPRELCFLHHDNTTKDNNKK